MTGLKMSYNYPKVEIEKRTRIAVGCLIKNDSFLLNGGVHERSIAHKLAEYLQEQFPDARAFRFSELSDEVVD